MSAFPLCLLMVVGCGSQVDPSSAVDEVHRALPIVRGVELSEYVRTSQRPVLVEFGVDYNCPRCAQTKDAVVQLSEDLHAEVDVVRVDFNSNAALVTQLGGTICPTYVLFDQGEPVLTRSFPYSVDLLEGEILRLAGGG